MSKEVDVLEQGRFWDGVDLRLDAIEHTNARKKERERDAKKHQQHQYIRI